VFTGVLGNILNQINAVHFLIHYFSKIDFNIINTRCPKPTGSFISSGKFPYEFLISPIFVCPNYVTLLDFIALKIFNETYKLCNS
jgi:hypothetical protein